MKNNKKVFLICATLCIGLLLLAGCSYAGDSNESRAISGEIVHIVDLSQEEQIDQDGYIIYVYAYVGDLMTVWVSDDTNLVDGPDGLLWEDVFSQQRTGVWFSGEVRPTEAINYERLPCLFEAKELKLQEQTVDQGGTDNG